MTELKGALIGAGFFAAFQAEAWRRIPAVKLVAVVDPLSERASRFAQQYGIPHVYSDLQLRATL